MISVLFQTESHFPVGRQKIVQAVVNYLGDKLKSESEVSVSIVGDRRMRQLNKDFRKIDETTDVLSFALNDPAESSKPFMDAPDGVLRLGDVVISYPQAVSEAAQENKLVDDKIAELVLHGLDHLLGIHHAE